MADRSITKSYQDVVREAEGLHALEMDREAEALLRTVPKDSEDYVVARACPNEISEAQTNGRCRKSEFRVIIIDLICHQDANLLCLRSGSFGNSGSISFLVGKGCSLMKAKIFLAS